MLIVAVWEEEIGGDFKGAHGFRHGGLRDWGLVKRIGE
jgi:hypothetical protein